MRILLFTLYFIVKLQISFSQTPNIMWAIAIGGTQNEEVRSIINTSDNKLLAVGNSSSNNGDVSGNHGQSDVFVVKLNLAGNIEWSKCFGGSNGDYGREIVQTHDGNFMILGYTSSSDGDVLGNHGSIDVWLIKIDPIGNLLWQKCLGGTGADQGIDIIETNDFGFLICAGSSSNDGDVSGNHGGGDFWIVKTDSFGTLQWQHSFGGSNSDGPSSVIQATNGDYIITGASSSNNGNVIGNHNVYPLFDFWVLRISQTGSLLWANCYGGANQETAYSVLEQINSDLIIVGYSSSNNGDVSGNHNVTSTDAWILKVDAFGNILSQKCVGGSDGEGSYSIIQDDNYNLILTGNSRSNDGDVSGNQGINDLWTYSLDSLFNINWQMCLGGSKSDGGHRILISSDSAIVVAGWTYSNDGNVTGHHGGEDIWIVKLSNLTNFQNELLNNYKTFFFQNPINDELHINFNFSEPTKVDMLILDISGNLIFEDHFDYYNFGFTKESISFNDFDSGVYICNIKINNIIYIEKLVCIK